MVVSQQPPSHRAAPRKPQYAYKSKADIKLSCVSMRVTESLWTPEHTQRVMLPGKTNYKVGQTSVAPQKCNKLQTSPLGFNHRCCKLCSNAAAEGENATSTRSLGG